MHRLYKISSIIYRIILTLFIPALLIGNFLVGSAGHNRNFDKLDYLLFAYIIGTVILLTLHENSDKRQNANKTIVFYVVAGLVLTSAILEIVALYDTFFICKCFTTGDNFSSALTVLFLLITIIVFAGLINGQKNLEKSS